MALFTLTEWEEVATPQAVPVFPEPQTETRSLGQHPVSMSGVLSVTVLRLPGGPSGRG